MKNMDYSEIILYNIDMKVISPALISGENVKLVSLEIFKAVWGMNNRWFGYAERKRPRAALFLVLSSVVAKFVEENERSPQRAEMWCIFRRA